MIQIQFRVLIQACAWSLGGRDENYSRYFANDINARTMGAKEILMSRVF